MREFQDKERRKRYLYSPIVLLLLSILVFFMAKGAASVMNKERESRAKVSELDKESQKLESRQKMLQANIGKLETEEGVIEEIRQKFNVTREGESVTIIVDNQEKLNTTSKDATWYKKWWNAIIQLND
ncbi:MAG TPA: septum formation initiator family protein [Candidatus Paceibacterota bacterium]